MTDRPENRERMAPRALIAAALCLLAGAAEAETPWLFGAWCGNLDVMRVDETGITFNDGADGVECQWATPPTPSPNYITTLSCVKMRVEGGEQITLEPWTGAIDFTRIAEDGIEAFFNDKTTTDIYTRCDR
jgi:hypothetical protein